MRNLDDDERQYVDRMKIEDSKNILYYIILIINRII